MKSIYLDMNIYNRPFDDQSQIRIRMETLSIFSLIRRIENRELELLWSFILDYENSLNPNEDIRGKIEAVSKLAARNIEANTEILQRARRYEQRGVKARDALHVASAVYGKADYFVTCDDRLSKKTVRIRTGMEILNPVDLLRQWG